MTPLDLGSWAAGALTGSMAGAIPVAVFAGLLSFFPLASCLSSLAISVM